MNSQESHDVMLEFAALYALGTLAPEDSVSFKAHLEAGCLACQEALEACEAVVVYLGYAAPAAHSPPTVHDRLLARIQTEAATNPRDSTIIRNGAAGWEAAGIAGIWMQSLYRDAATQRRTALVRMEADARYPAHRHTDSEELYVLAGDLIVEGQVWRTGDFCAAIEGSYHRSVSSAKGCLFIMTSSERDEIIEHGATGISPMDLVCVRASEGLWEDGPAAGVAVKRLFIDPTRHTMTALVRMEAGARLPRHRHVTTEQLYMLEGDGHVAGHVLWPGDYYRIAAETVHEVTYSEGGCLFLLMASRAEVLS